MKFLILCLFFIACQNRSIKNEMSTINFDKKSKSSINISDEQGLYGPISTEATSLNSDEEVSKVIAVKLMPALYNSFLYVQILKKLEKEKIIVNVIESNGFTALIAALYADSESMTDFEWKIFKLYKSLDGLESFSGSWQDKVLEFTQKEFKNKKLFQLKKLLLIPRVSKKKLYYDHDLKVSEAIALEIQNRTRESFYINPVFDDQGFKKTSRCDSCFYLSANSPRIKLENYASDQLSIFSKITGLVYKNDSKIHIIEDIEENMDKLNGLEIFYHKYDEKIDKLIAKIKDDISS